MFLQVFREHCLGQTHVAELYVRFKTCKIQDSKTLDNVKKKFLNSSMRKVVVQILYAADSMDSTEQQTIKKAK